MNTITHIYRLLALPAKTRGLLMVTGSLVLLIAGASFEWISTTTTTTISTMIVFTNVERTGWTLLQLAISNGFSDGFKAVFVTGGAFLLKGILTYYRRSQGWSLLIQLVGNGITLGTVASFVWATITTFGTHAFAAPPSSPVNCPHHFEEGCFNNFGGTTSIYPSVGFFGVILGLLIAVIGSWASPKNPDDNNAAVPATVTMDKAGKPN